MGCLLASYFVGFVQHVMQQYHAVARLPWAVGTCNSIWQATEAWRRRNIEGISWHPEGLTTMG